MAPVSTPVAMTASCRTEPSTRPARERCSPAASSSAATSPSRTASCPPLSPPSLTGAMARGTSRTARASRHERRGQAPVRPARSAPAAPRRRTPGRARPPGRLGRRPSPGWSAAGGVTGGWLGGPASSVRASPAVTTEPVTSTPDPPSCSSPSSASRTAVSIASSSRGSTATRSAPKTSTASAARSSAGSRRGEEFSVTTISSSTGSSAASMPRTSLSPSTATTPTSRRKENDSWSAATVAAAPAGLCAASTQHGRRAAQRLQPAGRGHRRRRPAGRCRRRSPRCPPPAPRNASTAASATAAFCAWCAPCSGRNSSSYTPPRPCSDEHLAADGDRRGRATPNSDALPGHRRAHLGRPPQQHLRRLGRLRGEHRDRARLDDAGLLGGDLVDGVAQVSGVVERDRRDHRDPAVGDVRRVPAAAQPTSTHRDVDRRVRERGEAPSR